jgi:hypothetical protein
MKPLLQVALAATLIAGAAAGCASRYEPAYVEPTTSYYGGPPPYYPQSEPQYYERRPYRQYGQAEYQQGGYYYPPGRYRTGNGCQPGYTVQDGLCKPYRGY